MESVMFVAAASNLLPIFKQKLQSAFPTASFTDATDQFVIHVSGRSRIYVEYAGTDLEYIGWEPQNIAVIFQKLTHQQHVYSIAYHDINAVKTAITHIADSDEVMVDNDCGDLLVGSELVRKIRNNPNWNWLRDFWGQDA